MSELCIEIEREKKLFLFFFCMLKSEEILNSLNQLFILNSFHIHNTNTGDRKRTAFFLHWICAFKEHSRVGRGKTLDLSAAFKSQYLFKRLQISQAQCTAFCLGEKFYRITDCLI
jgi:hypothetical protein